MIASVVRVPWHSDHGGYHQLLDYLPEVRQTTPPRTPLARMAWRTAHRAAARWCPLPFYPVDHFATDLRGLASRQPAHVLYGDEQFWFSRHRTAPTVVTYHQPPDQLAALLPPRQWHQLAPRAQRIIVLDPSQRDFFCQVLPPERVHLVPHGIDTTVFAPAIPRSRQGRALVLTVGWWLRDFATLDAVHQLLNQRYGDDVELVVVTRQANRRRWHRAARVLEGISEADLIALYQRAALLLLPLTGASANNALLEAMACGTPAVASDVGGIRHYTGNTAAAVLVPPGDPVATADSADMLLAELGTDTHTARREAARKRAESFAWPTVAAQVREVYQLIEADR